MLLLTIGLVAAAGYAAPERHLILGDFEDGWDEHWEEKSFTRAKNRFEVVEERDNAVLRVTSENSAAVLFRMFSSELDASGRLSWRWKVAASLADNANEKKKRGDDYAARVFVTFESRTFSRKVRAICYVWAGNEPVESVYRSPYSKKVGTIVLRTGNDEAGRWVFEERDITADYMKCFGKAPPGISGFAVMVDTDQTDATATAWFDDIVFDVRSPVSPPASEPIRSP